MPSKTTSRTEFDPTSITPMRFSRALDESSEPEQRHRLHRARCHLIRPAQPCSPAKVRTRSRRRQSRPCTEGVASPTAFGGTGCGRVWLTESGTNTIPDADVDDDAAAEFQAVIEDAGVHAAQSTAADFIL